MRTVEYWILLSISLSSASCAVPANDGIGSSIGGGASSSVGGAHADSAASGGTSSSGGTNVGGVSSDGGPGSDGPVGNGGTESGGASNVGGAAGSGGSVNSGGAAGGGASSAGGTGSGGTANSGGTGSSGGGTSAGSLTCAGRTYPITTTITNATCAMLPTCAGTLEFRVVGCFSAAPGSNPCPTGYEVSTLMLIGMWADAASLPAWDGSGDICIYANGATSQTCGGEAVNYPYCWPKGLGCQGLIPPPGVSCPPTGPCAAQPGFTAPVLCVKQFEKS